MEKNGKRVGTEDTGADAKRACVENTAKSPEQEQPCSCVTAERCDIYAPAEHNFAAETTVLVQLFTHSVYGENNMPVAKALVQFKDSVTMQQLMNLYIEEEAFNLEDVVSPLDAVAKLVHHAYYNKPGDRFFSKETCPAVQAIARKYQLETTKVLLFETATYGDVRKYAHFSLRYYIDN